MDKETLYYFLDELRKDEQPYSFWYESIKFERIGNQIKVHFSNRILVLVLPPTHHD